jgi:hypothetical protein
MKRMSLPFLASEGSKQAFKANYANPSTANSVYWKSAMSSPASQTISKLENESSDLSQRVSYRKIKLSTQIEIVWN